MRHPTRRLTRRFYCRDTTVVAQELLGKHVIHVVRGIPRVGRIVETEAYLGPHDRAAHSCRGITSRTAVMFGPPGHAYVYLVYGMHHCLNVVTGPKGHGAAVLIRALEPVSGLEGKTSGPGLLCKALGVDRRLSGIDLLGERLYLADPGGEVMQVVKRPRIGVDYAGSWARRLLRFYIRGNAHVSRP